MKVTFNKDELKNVFRKAITVVEQKSILPVTECFLINIKENQAVITGTNQQNFLQVFCECKSEDNFNMLIDANIINDSVSKFKTDEVVFEMKEHTVTVKSGRNKITLPSLDPTEFLYVPKEAKEYQTYEADTLLVGIEKVKVSISQDTLRPIMMGILVEQLDSDIVFTATNAISLISQEFSSIGFTPFKEVLPLISVKAITTVLEDADFISFGITDKHLVFKDDSHNLFISKQNGNFPDWRKVIPDNLSQILEFDKVDMLDTLKILDKYVSSTNSVLLTIKNNVLTVSAEDMDFQVGAKSEIECTSSQDIVIKANKKLLQMLVDNHPTDNITIKYEEGSKSILFNSPNYIGLLMLLL